MVIELPRKVGSIRGIALELLKISEDCLVMQTGVLGEKNLLRLRMLTTAFRACMALNVSNGLSYGNEVLTILKYYYGEFHPVVGKVLQNIGKLMLASGEPEEAKKTFIEALKILSASHTSKHPSYQKVVESIDECQKRKFAKENAFRDFVEVMRLGEIFNRMWM